ncbi:MAG: tyrosine-type recombinase/integrase [Desulfobacterales bacterium]
MPKVAKEMTAIEIKRLTTPGRHAVGVIPGLLLVVKDTGAKSWLLRTTIGDRRRNIGLGGYPEISLAAARDRARELKDLIRQGVDPVEQRKARRRALARSQKAAITFEEAARHCHKKKSTEFRSEKHAKDWFSSVERYAIPVIGRLPVNEVDLPHILSVLQPIWTTRTETATRLRQRLENILAWATVSGYRRGDNPARWKGHLDAILPKPSKVRTKNHFSALPWREVGAFMRRLRKRKGMAARALEWIILTACRSGEVRFATWEEIDLEERIWTIPATRMKAGREHRVPLTDDAMRLLESLPRLHGSPYVFPAARGGPLSDMTISAVCRRMKVEAVPHGFRSTFRDWCAESTNFPREVAEMALAHTIESAVEAAYRRGDLFLKRRKLMEAWAGFVNTVPAEAATVTPIRKGAAS